jgi:outer membrane usher protein
VQDQISAGFPVPYLSGSMNIGYANQFNVVGNRVRLLTTSYQRQIYGSASIYATAYADVAGSRNAGISLGLSIPFDNDITMSTGSSRVQSGIVVGAEAMKTLRQEPGSYGWRIRDREGAGQPLRSVGGAYRGNNGRVEGTIMQSPAGIGGTVENEGAVVVAGGDVFLSNRVNDAFAVVDAGAPDLEVSFENRPVARTNSRGKALVPTLNAYQRNKLSIDPRNLPLNASIDKTQEILAPADRSGVVVDFGIRTDERSITVIVVDREGKPLRAGPRGSTASGHKFAVGYDGRAFVRGVESNDVLTIRTADGTCQAELTDIPDGDAPRTIGPVLCK